MASLHVYLYFDGCEDCSVGLACTGQGPANAARRRGQEYEAQGRAIVERMRNHGIQVPEEWYVSESETIIQCTIAVIKGELRLVLPALDVTPSLPEPERLERVRECLSSLFGQEIDVRSGMRFPLPDTLRELLEGDECSIEDDGEYMINW